MPRGSPRGRRGSWRWSPAACGDGEASLLGCPCSLRPVPPPRPVILPPRPSPPPPWHRLNVPSRPGSPRDRAGTVQEPARLSWPSLQSASPSPLLDPDPPWPHCPGSFPATAPPRRQASRVQRLWQAPRRTARRLNPFVSRRTAVTPVGTRGRAPASPGCLRAECGPPGAAPQAGPGSTHPAWAPLLTYFGCVFGSQGWEQWTVMDRVARGSPFPDGSERLSQGEWT